MYLLQGASITMWQRPGGLNHNQIVALGLLIS